MDTTLEVSPRDNHGKGNNRKARAQGSVPAIVYGPTTGSHSVSVDPAKLLSIFKETGDRNTVLQLKVGGNAPIPCLVREVQRHPVSREILHVDFYAVPLEQPIELMVPLKPVGRPKGAVAGGRLRVIRRELKVASRYDRIPSTIEVDVSEMDVGNFIKASQIKTPEGVSIVIENDFNVLSMEGKRAEETAPAAAAPAEEAKKD